MKTKLTLITFFLSAFVAVNAQQAVPNGGLNTWSSVYAPTGWTSIEEIVPPVQGVGLIAEDQADKYEGTSSVKLTSKYVSLAGDTVPGTLAIGPGAFGGGGPQWFGTPFTSSPDTLRFAYKYAPNGNDSAGFEIKLHKAGGSSYKLTYNGILHSTGGNWAIMNLPLTSLYSDLTGTTDTLFLKFYSSATSGGVSATNGSVLRIDAVSFGYYVAPMGQPPVVFTLGHDAITTGPRNFNLYGVIKSPVDVAQYSFVYSTDPTFTTSASTPVKSVTSNSLAVVYGTVNSLTAASTYYYYLTASSGNGTSDGSTLNFYTDTVSPVFEIYGADIYADSLYGNYVSLNGRLQGLSGSHTISFEWGSKPNKLDSVYLSDIGSVSDANSHYPRTSISGLAFGTTWYYRMKAVNATDSLFSDIRPFLVGAPYTQLHSLPATSVATTTADMNGEVLGFPVPIKVDADYSNGFPGSYAHSPRVYQEFDTVLYNFQYHAAGLHGERIYTYRFSVESWLGNFYGNDILFITGNKDSVFQTVSASNVIDTSAQLHGFAQKLGLQLAAGFEYGTTPALGTYILAEAINDSLAHSPTVTINGLLPNTTYYYSMRGNFQFGSGYPRVYGDTLQFTTGTVGLGNELDALNSLRVYPNPTASAIYLTNDNNAEIAGIKIFDIAGQELLSKPATVSNKVDISALAAGVYFVQTNNKAGDRTGAAKFIKQ